MAPSSSSHRCMSSRHAAMSSPSCAHECRHLFTACCRAMATAGGYSAAMPPPRYASGVAAWQWRLVVCAATGSWHCRASLRYAMSARALPTPRRVQVLFSMLARRRLRQTSAVASARDELSRSYLSRGTARWNTSVLSRKNAAWCSGERQDYRDMSRRGRGAARAMLLPLTEKITA